MTVFCDNLMSYIFNFSSFIPISHICVYSVNKALKCWLGEVRYRYHRNSTLYTHCANRVKKKNEKENEDSILIVS